MNEKEKWGFDQYIIDWSGRKKSFSLNAFNSKFFGFYRKEKSLNGDDYHIDIFVEVKDKQLLDKPKHCLGVISIPYVDDPREDMRSLRSDICAAVNQWNYQRCTVGVMYEDLVKHLENPTVTINRIDQLLEINEKVQHLINVGGKDLIKINGISIIIDVPKNTQVRLPAVYKPSKESKVTDDMVQAVAKFDASGDPDTKKLRKRLRRLGWIGGLRKFREVIDNESVPQ